MTFSRQGPVGPVPRSREVRLKEPALKSKTNENALDRILIILLPLYCLTTLLQGTPPFEYINRLMVVPVLLLVVGSMLISTLEHWVCLELVALCLSMAISVALTEWTAQAVAQAPRGFFCVILLLYATTRFEEVRSLIVRHIVYMRTVALTWTVLVAISIPLPTSWDAKWGGDAYFVSFTETPFQLMPTAMIVMAINICGALCGQRNIVSLALAIVPIYAGLQGGSRTYFILVVLMLLLLISTMNLGVLERISIVALSIATVGYFFAGSGIMAKMLNATSLQTQIYSGLDPIGALTSGRSEFWTHDLRAFFDLSLLQQFIGGGFHFSYSVNLSTIGLSIYAHNDFINLLMEGGYLALAVYLVAVCAFLKKVASINHPSSLQFLLLCLIWFVNAFVNMFYPYTSSVIAFLLTGAALTRPSTAISPGNPQ